MIRYLQHLRDAIVVDLLAHIVDQVVGYFPQGVRVADFKTLLYVFCDDGLHEALYVSTLIAQVLHFRKTSIIDIVNKCRFLFGLGFCCDATSVDATETTIFSKREWKQMDFIVTARQMCCQLSTEQFGITSRYHNVQVGA